MLNSLSEINERIGIINDLLPTFDTDERKEIKKNNKLIGELVEELTGYKELIYSELLVQRDGAIPKRDTKQIDENNEVIASLMDDINYLSDFTYMVKLGFDRDLYDIENSLKLEDVNAALKRVVGKFDLIGISLSDNDFTYGIVLYEYMREFFLNLVSDDFNRVMQDVFDRLYWQDPSLIKDLGISVRNVIVRYSKQFNSYIKSRNVNKSYDEVLLRYFDLKRETADLVNRNLFLNFNLFLDRKLVIDDYLETSSVRKDVISRFIDYDRYVNLSLEGKRYFFKEISGLYYSINEYLFLDRYKVLIDRVKEIYKEKDKYKTDLKDLEKSIGSLVKRKDKNNRKLFGIYRKLGKGNDRYNRLFNEVGIQNQELIKLYDEYSNAVFINDVITKLNDSSTYYDLLRLYVNNYNYLMSLVGKSNIEFDYDEFIGYIYNPYLVISKNVSFCNDIDIREKLRDKYSLYNINFELDDNSLLELKGNLSYLYNLSYFEETGIDLERIKVIMEIDKIKGS